MEKISDEDMSQKRKDSKLVRKVKVEKEPYSHSSTKIDHYDFISRNRNLGYKNNGESSDEKKRFYPVFSSEEGGNN